MGWQGREGWSRLQYFAGDEEAREDRKKAIEVVDAAHQKQSLL